MLKQTIVAASLLTAGVCAAVAQEGGDANRGLAYATANCAECHAVLAGEATSPRTRVATFKVIAETPGMTAMALSVWLQSTHKSMPNFIISAQDRADVIAYILSLRDQRTGR